MTKLQQSKRQVNTTQTRQDDIGHASLPQTNKQNRQTIDVRPIGFLAHSVTADHRHTRLERLNCC